MCKREFGWLFLNMQLRNGTSNILTVPCLYFQQRENNKFHPGLLNKPTICCGNILLCTSIICSCNRLLDVSINSRSNKLLDAPPNFSFNKLPAVKYWHCMEVSDLRMPRPFYPREERRPLDEPKNLFGRFGKEKTLLNLPSNETRSCN